MPASVYRLFLLAGLLLALGPGRAQTLDTEAATAYWQITDALRRNEPLTNARWREFLALPANKVYVASTFGSDTADLAAYRRAIEVVYMPRYNSLRQAKIKAKRWYYVLVNNYKEHEKEHQALLAETAKTLRIWKKCTLTPRTTFPPAPTASSLPFDCITLPWATMLLRSRTVLSSACTMPIATSTYAPVL